MHSAVNANQLNHHEICMIKTLERGIFVIQTHFMTTLLAVYNRYALRFDQCAMHFNSLPTQVFTFYNGERSYGSGAVELFGDECDMRWCLLMIIMVIQHSKIVCINVVQYFLVVIFREQVSKGLSQSGIQFTQTYDANEF